MNRLIIIGNGFDLAHGLRTNTKHFLDHYFLNVMKKLKLENSYNDSLLSVNPYTNLPGQMVVDPNEKYDESNSMRMFTFYKANKQSIDVKFNSMLFLEVYNKMSKMQWVDMESLYYKHLLKTIEDSSNPRKNQKEFFEQFEELKSKVIDYLILLGTAKINEQSCNVCFDKMGEVFNKEIDYGEILYDIEKQELEDVCFVNFNYTPLPEAYLRHVDSKHNPQIIYIHGDLQEKYGKPIYGFGDEFDERYGELEKREDTSVLRDIKSFQYLLNDNYANLMKFIDANEFQVQIMGHSCGLSDRTLLKQIFEHDNCKSIKIYYHEREDGTTDYVSKTYELSRHFSNKQEFRKKLVPFDKCSAMPQNK